MKKYNWDFLFSADERGNCGECEIGLLEKWAKEEDEAAKTLSEVFEKNNGIKI